MYCTKQVIFSQKIMHLETLSTLLEKRKRSGVIRYELVRNTTRKSEKYELIRV